MTKKKAEKKARLNGNTLRNHANRTIDDLASANNNTSISVVNWDKIEETAEYKQSYNDIINLYNTDKKFLEDANLTTKQVLKITDEESLKEGVQYLLEELSFIMASPKIYNQNVVYIYHREWLIFENMINKKYAIETENLGFLIVK